MCHAQSSEKPDPFLLVLVSADLQNAEITLKQFDTNDNQWIDKDERRNLPWRESAVQFDLNRDDKLTHLEIAVYFASQREEHDVQEIDITVVSRALNKYDLNRNGQIDPNERTDAWPEDPDEIDENADGVLSKSELTKAFAFRRVVRNELGIMGVDQGWSIKIRNRFDEDGNGKLGPAEWKRTPLPNDPSKGDENEDGQLSQFEMAKMLARYRQKIGINPKDQLAARAAFAPLDSDFDGVISKAEWMPIEAQNSDAIARLKEFDANKDDMITLKEVEQELTRRRDEKGYLPRHDAEAMKLMMRHDINRDKRISLSELRKEKTEGYLSTGDLPNIDRDADEFISRDELARYVAGKDRKQ